MPAKGTVFVSGENLDELYELQEWGFVDDDEDFNRELESSTAV